MEDIDLDTKAESGGDQFSAAVGVAAAGGCLNAGRREHTSRHDSLVTRIWSNN